MSVPYGVAKEAFSRFGVDAEEVLAKMRRVSLSVHCWQGDDVGGFEKSGTELGGGILATGNFLGKPRGLGEYRMDMQKVFSLIPGRHRLSLHASYGDFGGAAVDRDQITPQHFASWVDWARTNGVMLDFNCTLFSHPKAASGYTLSHREKDIRSFWIEHCRRCREISAFMGRELCSPCIHNVWIPDGAKDTPIDRMGCRDRLVNSLDQIFSRQYKDSEMRDTVEGKLFGIGSESFTVGSNDFYLGYAITRNKLLTMDMGHYHPTESVADKISSVLQFVPEVLVHVSRPVRWDSDHVVTLSDEVKELAAEIVRGDVLNRVHLGLDFFDASINRVGAYVIGSHALLKAVMIALLEPRKLLMEADKAGDGFKRLALLEEAKALPFGAVWDEYCTQMGVPTGMDLIEEIKRYEMEATPCGPVEGLGNYGVGRGWGAGAGEAPVNTCDVAELCLFMNSRM